MTHTINQALCEGCATCMFACCTSPCAVEDDGGTFTINPVYCNDCGACVDACPFGAIIGS